MNNYGDMSLQDIRNKYDIEQDYKAIHIWLKESGVEFSNLPVSAVNENGEDVVITGYRDDEYRKLFNSDIVYCIDTIQSNDWIRRNYYHPDGTIEELYEK